MGGHSSITPKNSGGISRRRRILGGACVISAVIFGLLAVREYTASSRLDTTVALLSGMGFLFLLEWWNISTTIDPAFANQSVREQAELIRMIVENSLDAVVAMDIRGHVTTWNSRAEVMFGWPREEALGRPLADLIIPTEFREAHWRGLQRYLATGEQRIFNKRIELRALRKDGSEFDVELTVTPVTQSGAILFSAFLRDITERKLAAAEIQALQTELEQRVQDRTRKLEEANKELEAFSYSISHDLRAPLRHINVYTTMLKNSLGDQLPDKESRHLKNIGTATSEMNQLIDDLLSFSRLSRVDLKETRVDLGPTVLSCVQKLKDALPDRTIAWKIGELPNVLGDAAMIRQVVSNLLENAVKYTGPRNPAEIEVACAGEENGMLVFFVRDNGVGFDSRYKYKLFRVFQRLHSAEQFEGTGIGLANVQRIIQRHGGRTWAEGQIDQGATFYFTLKPAPGC